MEPYYYARDELIRKYRLAGKIRFISFSLLLLFLLIMKFIGGYSYLNVAFVALIFVEAILNQPYNFIIRRVELRRLQYYQMAIDIIAVSWLLYYTGGIEAPLVSIGYYVVILWAGVVSSIHAVIFATILSALLFSLVVILSHMEILPFISHFNYKMPVSQMLSLLFGNVSFLFAFGYFCAHSSNLIKFLERKRKEEALRHTHKFAAAGNLIGNTAHDVLNFLGNVKGYAEILLSMTDERTEQNKMLKAIYRAQGKAADMLTRLGRFSQRPRQQFEAEDIHQVIDDAFELTWPLVRYASINIDKQFAADIPLIMMDREQIQEVFVVFIFNSLDAIGKGGRITIKTSCIKSQEDMVEIVFSDTGKGISPDNLRRIAEPFFTTKTPEEGLGIGLTVAYGIISRHNGVIYADSRTGEGTTFTIRLPVSQPERDALKTPLKVSVV